jgi:hypothetical protein
MPHPAHVLALVPLILQSCDTRWCAYLASTSTKVQVHGYISVHWVLGYISTWILLGTLVLLRTCIHLDAWVHGYLGTFGYMGTLSTWVHRALGYKSTWVLLGTFGCLDIFGY